MDIEPRYLNVEYVPDNAEDGEVFRWEDFLDEAKGNVKLAQILVDECDWQFPSTEIDQMEIDGELVEVGGKYVLTHDICSEPNPTIRGAVAQNPNTPPDVLAELVQDKEGIVRVAVAANTNTPIYVLTDLANDESGYVREAVANNPSTPPDVLVDLANDKDRSVYRWVALNPHTPTDVLAELTQDEDYRVRGGVASNSSTSNETLVELSHDENREVRYIASKNLAGRMNTQPLNMDKVPPLYSQDGKGESAIVYAHLLNASSNWWITEYDPDERVAFGFACLNNDWEMAEFGYVSLDEIDEMNQHFLSEKGSPAYYMGVAVQDPHWIPRPIKYVEAYRMNRGLGPMSPSYVEDWAKLVAEDKAAREQKQNRGARIH